MVAQTGTPSWRRWRILPSTQVMAGWVEAMTSGRWRRTNRCLRRRPNRLSAQDPIIRAGATCAPTQYVTLYLRGATRSWNRYPLRMTLGEMRGADRPVGRELGDMGGARRPLLCIGHAGASALAPANTLRSFGPAARLGVDVVEFDLRCARGRLVLAHTVLDAWRPGCLELAPALRWPATEADERLELVVDLKTPGSEEDVVAPLRPTGSCGGPSLRRSVRRPCSACRRLELARAIAGKTPEVAVDEARSALAAFRALGASRGVDAAAALLRDLGGATGGHGRVSRKGHRARAGGARPDRASRSASRSERSGRSPSGRWTRRAGRACPRATTTRSAT